MLLTCTHACGFMNGFKSGMREFNAGVRQGCPLSPLLYLFVGEALLRYLMSKDIHITVHGVRLTSTQYADDTQVYLPSPEIVPAFLAAMDTFTAASGQRLNLQKSKVLLLGPEVRRQHATLVLNHAFGTLPLSPVMQAEVLGVQIGYNADDYLTPEQAKSVNWGEQIKDVLKAYTRLSHVRQLSLFGRGLGSATYGVSKLLFAAEFSDLPPSELCKQLSDATEKLVDRGLMPSSHEFRHHHEGVTNTLLLGSPSEGGAGVLPWMQHIKARHAWWGALFVTAPDDTELPWIQIGRAVLRSKCNWWGSLAVFDSSAAFQVPMDLTGINPFKFLPPPPLQRMFIGLQALDQICDIRADNEQQDVYHLPQLHPQHITDLAILQDHMHNLSKAPVLCPGAWCALLPVFANPLLQARTMPGVIPGGLQWLPVPARRGPFYFRGGHVRPCIRTLGDLLRSWFIIQNAVTAQQDHPLLGHDTNCEGELDDLNSLIAEVPSPWLQCALHTIQHADAQPSWPPVSMPQAPDLPSAAEQIVESMLISRLGWRNLPHGRSVAVSDLTVKKATLLQLGPMRSQRRAQNTVFVRLALGVNTPALIDQGLRSLSGCFKRLWTSVKWDNNFKEVYWRLVSDTLNTAHSMNIADSTCFCGFLCPDSVHHYWECPIAQAVVQSIMMQLSPMWCARTPGVCPLKRQHIWLMQPPPANKRMHKGVWCIVGLAAINAMDVGRKATNMHSQQQNRLQHSEGHIVQQQLPTSQRLITSFLQPAPLSAAQQQHQHLVDLHRQQQQQQLEMQQQLAAAQRLQNTQQQAVARFWELITDSIVMHAVPLQWTDQVPADHPFISTDPVTHLYRCTPRSI